MQRLRRQHEKDAESDRHHDDARLVAGTMQAVDRLPQLERADVSRAPDEIDEQQRGEIEHERGRRQSREKKDPDANRPRLPRRERGQRDDDERAREPAQNIEPFALRARFVAQEHVGLDVPDAQERQRGEQHRDEQAETETLRHRARRETVFHVGRQARGEVLPDDDERDFRQHDAEETSRQTEREHLREIRGGDLSPRSAETLEHGDGLAFLLDEDARYA